MRRRYSCAGRAKTAKCPRVVDRHVYEKTVITMAIEDQSRLVTKSTLKTVHGFTDKALIQLGPPHDTVPNPHYKCAQPMCLYSLDRALEFKRSHPNLFDDTKRERRRAAAAKGIATKLAALQKLLETNPLKLIYPLPPTFEALRTRARSHADDRHGSNACEPGISGIIACVRHEYTNYEDVLSIIKGRCGKESAYDDIRWELDNEIARWLEEKYPDERVLDQLAQCENRD